jgi:hypothetical protein
VRRPPLNSSFPHGKDDKSRLLTVVREQWNKYQGQEKRFSKDFALALINLHKQEAKPGYGKFVVHLKDLKIPTSTAYRLMRLHGWEPENRIAKTYTPEQHRAERHSMLISQLGVYLDGQENKLTALEKLCSEILGYAVTVSQKEVAA